MIRTPRRRLTAAVTAARPTAVAESLERRQLMSAALSVSSSLMVYNAVKNANSQTETLTLTDTGDQPLTLGSSAFALSGSSAAQWTLNDASTAPATLAVGASFGLTLTYKPTIVGRQTATLTVTTNDAVHPAQAVALSGIGAAGIGGSNQPSLARILRAYNIPTIVGEGLNDSAEATDSTYPNPPDGSSQEVSLQQLVKAGSGPVTINVLASFTAAGTEPYTLGYYTPGRPQDRHELFYTPSSEYQSTYVQPQGSTSFDPGSKAFGLYFVSNVQVAGRIGYSEDALNTFDTTNNRKFRFFPNETAAGVVIPNSYVMTSTEYDSPAGYDFTNIVAIINNVTAAPNAPTTSTLTVTDPYALPGSSNVEFTNIRFPNTTIGDTQHNTDTLTLTDTGEAAMSISSLTLSNTAAWSISAGPQLPILLAPGASTTVTLKYNDRTTPSSSYNETADPNNPGGGGFETGTLTIGSSDLNTPSKVINLAGYTQYHSEDSNEPSLQTITNLLEGYSTVINGSPVSELPESTSTSSSSPTYYGEETVSGYWSQADAARPVVVDQIAAYHTEGDADTFGYYKQGTTSVTTVVNQATDDGQTIFPLNSSGTWATGSFSTTSTFGFRLSGSAGTEWSDDTKNTYYATGGGHHMRFYPVRDYQGTVVPNTYICTMDYASATQNFDFQDNVYLITNVRPRRRHGRRAVGPDRRAGLQRARRRRAGQLGPQHGRQRWRVQRLPPERRLHVHQGHPDADHRHQLPGHGRRPDPGEQLPRDGRQRRWHAGVDRHRGHRHRGRPARRQRLRRDLRPRLRRRQRQHPRRRRRGRHGQPARLPRPGRHRQLRPQPRPGRRHRQARQLRLRRALPGDLHRRLRPAPVPQPYAARRQRREHRQRPRRRYGRPRRLRLRRFGLHLRHDLPGLQRATASSTPASRACPTTRSTSITTATASTTPPRRRCSTPTPTATTPCPGLPVGSYVLNQVTRPGWSRSIPAGSVTINVTENATIKLNWGETRGTLYGTVFNDANGNGSPDATESGIAGINVFIDAAGTGVYQAGDTQVTTAANGMFMFPNLRSRHLHVRRPAAAQRLPPEHRRQLHADLHRRAGHHRLQLRLRAGGLSG